MSRSAPSRILEVFLVFLRLGLTSFGGPVAHIGFFRDEFVDKRKWLTENEFGDLIALCQFLPGPASSEFGFAVGLKRAGYPGAFAAWTGFTLPSAAIMIGFALGVTHFSPAADQPWMQGLKIAVVVVVAKAIWGMATNLCPDRARITMAFAAAAVMLALSTAWAQVLVIIAGGIVGAFLYRAEEKKAPSTAPEKFKAASMLWIAAFFVLLIGLPILANVTGSEEVSFFRSFYQGGALVFGGGHVVLPLLRESVVPPGWTTDDLFMTGYGAAQALPGPLFTISAYLGTVSTGPGGGVTGGLVALVAIFLPSWLLVFGAMPLWERLRKLRTFAAGLKGTNAAVVGILMAAFYDPVWLSGIASARHLIIGLILFALTMYWKLPPWTAVILAALLGMAFLSEQSA